MKILCYGSLNIDYVYTVDHFVRKGETLGSKALSVFTGGKGLNQSVALQRAGVSVMHAGAIGEDGRFLLEVLNDSGVDTSLVKVLPDVRTGNAVIQNDRTGDNCILLYGGANRAITEEMVEETLSHFSEGDWIILQNEISCLPFIMRKAHEKGMKIVLNPSPIDDSLRDLPFSEVDVFLINEIEAAAILQIVTGKEAVMTDPKTLSRKLLAAFPGAVTVLTLGENGSVYISKDNAFFQKAYPVKAVDTTAAGDTFTGYFVAGLLSGESPEESMDTAARASAIAVTRKGAAPSIPMRKEVEDSQWKKCSE